MEEDKGRFHILDIIPDLILCVPAIAIAVLLIVHGGIK